MSLYLLNLFEHILTTHYIWDILNVSKYYKIENTKLSSVATVSHNIQNNILYLKTSTHIFWIISFTTCHARDTCTCIQLHVHNYNIESRSGLPCQS